MQQDASNYRYQSFCHKNSCCSRDTSKNLQKQDADSYQGGASDDEGDVLSNTSDSDDGGGATDDRGEVEEREEVANTVPTVTRGQLAEVANTIPNIPGTHLDPEQPISGQGKKPKRKCYSMLDGNGKTKEFKTFCPQSCFKFGAVVCRGSFDGGTTATNDNDDADDAATSRATSKATEQHDDDDDDDDAGDDGKATSLKFCIFVITI